MPELVPVLPDWRALVRLSDAELAGFDVACVNLACAAGLPGAARIDAGRCLRALDHWALGVGEITQHALDADFRHNPADYDHSEPLFRMVTLIRVLQVRCRVLYNPAQVGARPDDPIGTDDQFIHGAIQGPGGTCASLPVVYAAVARRLGYPVRLVAARGHRFCRWDDPTTGERVNIEGTSHDGVNTHPDEHYRKWPFPITPGDEALFGYLRSMTPRQELAAFLFDRSGVFESAGLYLDAVDALVGAVAADAPGEGYPQRLYQLVRRWGKLLWEEGRIGAGFHCPPMPVGPRRWPGMPWEVEAEIVCLDAASRGVKPPWMAG